MAHQLLQASFLFSIGLICTAHSPIYQTKLEVCPVLKHEVDYIPHGTEFNLGNLRVYETNDVAPKRLLIGVHDIFGDTKNTRLFADFLGETYGFRVAMPDFYRGIPWDHAKWPPNMDEYSKWSNEVANYDTVVKFDIQNLIHYYHKNQSITEFGIFGFCWGGMVSSLASSDFPDIKVVGLVHPSSLTNKMAENIMAPTYIVPCKDDPDMMPFYEILKKKFGDNSGHRRYNDMCHGFATSMGNYSEPLIFQRVEQTIDILGNFFLRNLHDN